MILVDIESSVDLLFFKTIQVLWVKDNDITKKEIPLLGFNINTIYVVRKVVLLVMVTNYIIMTKFIVIDVFALYNGILERN